MKAIDSDGNSSSLLYGAINTPKTNEANVKSSLHSIQVTIKLAAIQKPTF